MHRKFITLIVATAITITGLSLTAAPARAGSDTAKVLAGFAALALIGAAIQNNRDRAREAHVVTRTTPPRYTPPRPLPSHVAQYDLPRSCLRAFPKYQRGKLMLGQACLRSYYGQTVALPNACKVSFWNGRINRTGYEPACLNQSGYRLTHR